MIKKYNNFLILENRIEQHHVIIRESLLELIDDGYLKDGNIYFEEGNSFEQKHLIYFFNVNINEYDISSYRKLFEGLDVAKNRLGIDCKFKDSNITFKLNINTKLQKFINESSIEYDYGLFPLYDYNDVALHLNEYFNEKDIIDNTILFKGVLTNLLPIKNIVKEIPNITKWLHDKGAFDVFIEKEPQQGYSAAINFKMYLY
jgi:hypothetical protein